MEKKINLKTILLFTALFILGGLILGFYSCSANNTPTTPDDAFTKPTPPTASDLGIDSYDDDKGTQPKGPIGSVTAPGKGETGSRSYSLEIDANGNVNLTSSREGSYQFKDKPFDLPLPDGETFVLPNLVTLELGTFTEIENHIWQGNATIYNDATFALFNPRLAWSTGVANSVISDNLFHNAPYIREGLLNLDGLCTISENDRIAYNDGIDGYTDIRTYYSVAFPFLFIADEDENWTILPGESATHEIILESPTEGWVTFYIHLLAEIVDEPSIGHTINGVPHGITAKLEENTVKPGRIVTVNVEVDDEYWQSPCIVEDDITHQTVPLRPAGYADGKAMLIGDFQAKPSDEGTYRFLVAISPPTIFNKGAPSPGLSLKEVPDPIGTISPPPLVCYIPARHTYMQIITFE